MFLEVLIFNQPVTRHEADIKLTRLFHPHGAASQLYLKGFQNYLADLNLYNDIGFIG